MGKVLISESELSSIADSIRSKTGSQEQIQVSNFDTNIDSIPLGPVESKDVNFYDYLGNIVYSYTAQEFQALTELPAGPSHTGMTFQEWNWTLSDAKTQLTAGGFLDIGESCITSDGKTRIYFTLYEGRLEPYLILCASGSVSVDWGDGTSESIEGTGANNHVSTKHVYSAPGNYVITLDSSYKIYTPNNSYNRATLLSLTPHNSMRSGSDTDIYAKSIYKVELGENFVLNKYSFYGTCLESINLPSYITSIGEGAFVGSDIKCLVIPRGISSFGNYALNTCRLLSVLCLPNANVNYSNIFYNVLERLVIPEAVTTMPCLNTITTIKKLRVSDNITTLPQRAISSLKNLESFNIPSGLVSISATTQSTPSISGLDKISELTFPSTMTTLPKSCLIYNSSIIRYTFLGDITEIGSGAFTYNYSLKVIDLRHCTSVPTLIDKYAFTGINNSDYQIVVPDSLYEDWIVADVWSDSSVVTHIIKDSDFE